MRSTSVCSCFSFQFQTDRTGESLRPHTSIVFSAKTSSQKFQRCMDRKKKQISIDPRGCGSSLFAIHQPQARSRIAVRAFERRKSLPQPPSGRAFLQHVEVYDLVQKPSVFGRGKSVETPLCRILLIFNLDLAQILQK